MNALIDINVSNKIVKDKKLIIFTKYLKKQEEKRENFQNRMFSIFYKSNALAAIYSFQRLTTSY